jgi:hypothetical protein
MTLKLYNTLPNKKEQWWQIVLIPTISIMHKNKYDSYVAINFEFLFWSCTIIIG